MKKSFIENLIGPSDPGIMAAAFVFALLGILLTLLMGSTSRDPNSKGSPFSFSWRYLLSDNSKRIMASLLAVIITIRFMPEILNLELKVWYGFGVGMCWDGLALFIKQKTRLLDKKPQS